MKCARCGKSAHGDQAVSVRVDIDLPTLEFCSEPCRVVALQELVYGKVQMLGACKEWKAAFGEVKA